jgi:AcrR family transcriptional regulator
MNRKVEQGQATREQLVETATRLFGDRGYEATSIEAVLHESGVSRGALYHHFASKEALFDAVLESVEADATGKVVAATIGISDAVASIRAGCLAWVRLAGDPVVQRIVLIDAPSVLGWQRWREIDERYGLGITKVALLGAAEAGRLAPELVDPFAHMLLGALNEMALVIARSEDSARQIRAGEAAVDELLRRLLGD